MVNLFDIARQAQSGTAFGALSRRFGLDLDQTQRAVEALLPAFTLALQRSALDPSAFANLLGMVGSGRFAPFFDGPSTGGAGRSGETGESVVLQLFGSPDASRRIAAQASALTGIGAQVLAEMMPILAASLVGGMFRYATAEGFADFLRKWSDAIRAASPRGPQPPPARDPWSAWVEFVRASLGGLAPPPPANPPRPAGDAIETWSRLMFGFVGEPEPPPEPPRPNPSEAVLRMFETGREVQAQYLAGLRAILDAVWATPPSPSRG